MSGVSQILLLGDEKSDIKLIQSELHKIKITVQLDVISREAQLTDRLKSNPPDLIISSFPHPSLTIPEALTIVRDNHPYLPLIVISDSPDEEKAMKAILEGASDYISKQNLNRLGPSVLRETVRYKEQEQQRVELKKTHTRYESLLQSVNGIVWEADADTFEFCYISPQSKELLGFTPEEWLSNPNFWQEHIHPDDRQKAINFCHHKTQQGVNHSFEYRMFDANDEVVWLRDYVTVISTNGKPDRLRGLMVDISKEKVAERQRDKAYKIADIGHWELDLVNEQLFWSDAIKKLHEVEDDFNPNLETAIEFYKKGEHRQKIVDAVEQAIEKGNPFDVELKIITAENNERWIRAVGEPEFRNGNCIRIFGSTQNITARKEIELKFRSVVEHSTNMFYRHDTDHVLNYVSPQAQEFLGYPPEEAKQRWTEFITDHPKNKEGFKHTQRAIETTETQPAYPLQLQKRDGEKIWVQVNEAPVVENGKTIAIVGSLTDITDQKESHEQLKQLNEELEKRAEELAAANEELEQFAYVASHDLQEPLRMVSSFLERLEQKYGDQLDEKAQQYIDFAVDGAHRMRRIILDLLNYSRMNKNDFERDQIDSNDLIKEIIKAEQAIIEENDAEIAFGDLPVIEASKTPIQQVFQNLINNALKYHRPSTKPVIKIASKETDKYWQFSVTDNGIGIKEEFQDNIFTIFQRLHTQDEYAGTGIGLSVSKKIIEKHGGEIWVKSEEGKGSTFYFTVRKPA
jgi:PAS domain S-box-containing protein